MINYYAVQSYCEYLWGTCREQFFLLKFINIFQFSLLALIFTTIAWCKPQYGRQTSTLTIGRCTNGVCEDTICIDGVCRRVDDIQNSGSNSGQTSLNSSKLCGRSRNYGPAYDRIVRLINSIENKNQSST